MSIWGPDAVRATRIDVRDLRAGFGGHDVLRGVDLQVGEGEVVAVLGPNGAGKSTLLRAIAGLLPVASGTIHHEGRVAIALQEAPLADTSVRRNVELALRWWRDERRASWPGRIQRALEAFGIEDLAARNVRSLSGGQRRRVHLARTLAVGPGAVLLDEPFAGLDQEVRADLLGDVAGLIRVPGRASVIVVHDRAEAWALADRVVILLDGRAAADGATSEVFTQPQTPEVARFVGFTGSLHEGDRRRMVRPTDITIGGTTRAVVQRQVPTEAGTLLDCRTRDGEVQVMVRDAPPPVGAEVTLDVRGGVTFPAPDGGG